MVINRFIERSRERELNKTLEKICQKDPEVARMRAQALSRPPGCFGGFAFCTEHDLGDMAIGENAFHYFREVVRTVALTYGVRSKEFQEASKRLLTKKERKLVARDVLRYTKPGSPLGEDFVLNEYNRAPFRRLEYLPEERIRLFDEAKRIYDESLRHKLSPDENEDLGKKHDAVISNPLYKYFSSSMKS